MSTLLHDLFFDYTVRTVALGALLLGIVSGALGAFAVLRRQALLGDAISHTALPGVVIAFMLTGSRASLPLVLGAAAAGGLATLVIALITRHSRIKYDSALGLVLSVFFGIGLVLLTYVQRQPGAARAGLDRFLFGQASALMVRDLVIIGVIGVVVLVLLALFWKEFRLLGFDPAFGRSIGFSMRGADAILTSLLVLAIVIGLQTVGVVLMSAMVVAPAVAARQWTDRLGRMVVLSAAFGALAGVSGALASSLVPRLPTGPTIVLSVSLLVVVSLLGAPRSGLLWQAVSRVRRRRRLQVQSVVLNLHELAGTHASFDHPHPAATLRYMSAVPGAVVASLTEAERRGWVRRQGDGWTLTDAGIRQADQMQSDMGGGR